MTVRIARQKHVEDERPPVQFYPTLNIKKPRNALIVLRLGLGHDPDALKAALKKWKFGTADVLASIRRHEKFVPANQARRTKSHRARSRVAKATRKRELVVDFLDAHPRAPRREATPA